MARPWSDHSRVQGGSQRAWVQVDHALHRPRLVLVVSNHGSGFWVVWGVCPPTHPIAELPRPLISDLCLALQHISWEISSMCPTGLTRTWERVKLAYRPEFSSTGKTPFFPVFKDKFSSSDLPQNGLFKEETIEMHFLDPFMKANTLIFILNAKFPLKKEKHSWADFSQQPLLRGVMSHDLPSPQGSHLQTLYILFNNIWIFYMILVIFHCQVWKCCCESADLFSLIVKINENSSDSVHDETESGVRWCQKLRQITFFFSSAIFLSWY